MGFDIKAFDNAKFEDRTAEVPVPDLKDFFDEDSDPVFVVRGLTGEELARCHEAADRSKTIDSVVQALGSTGSADKIDAMRELLGVSETVPVDLAKRLEQFAIGTVSPGLDHTQAVRFAEVWPVEFYQITNKIMELTGQGRQIAKKKDSGGTAKSGQQ